MLLHYLSLSDWVAVSEQMSQLNCHHNYSVMVHLRHLSGLKIHWITNHFLLTGELYLFQTSPRILSKTSKTLVPRTSLLRSQPHIDMRWWCRQRCIYKEMFIFEKNCSFTNCTENRTYAKSSKIWELIVSNQF